MNALSPFAYDHDGARLAGVTCGDPDAPVAAVVLHGAGRSDKERLLPLLGEFAARGGRGVAFDFAGHGESSGALRESSLRHRFEQAVAVIDAQVPADRALVLAGFSMSGQTVADLAAHYGDRVRALALCAPAVYAAQAWELPFGTGDGRFSAVIRRPGSWRGSPALDAFRAYRGRAVLAVPGTDAVIPPAVTEAVQDALSCRARYTRFELPGADHSLGLWFLGHGADRRAFVTAVLSDRGGEGAGGGPLSVGVGRMGCRASS
ncbi:alpha/beta hydrolase [Streptomyces sp. NPDC089424]|uniref:alpha/beta hydrolase n=1 Tax=Streptomyces sp. NPDC089424 TaxID=3365917 RepID=UPI00382D0BDD